VARGLCLEAGTILAIDRGYNDYVWFGQVTRRAVTHAVDLVAMSWTAEQREDALETVAQYLHANELDSRMPAT
jgi:methylmalonyl-CoA mutase cobalamin-binding subunit